MAPTIVDGDWLLVDPDAHAASWPRPGELVVAKSGGRLVVKRVAAVSGNGDLALAGDAPSVAGHGHDMVVEPAALAGRPWFRYWPPRRAGPVR